MRWSHILRRQHSPWLAWWFQVSLANLSVKKRSADIEGYKSMLLGLHICIAAWVYIQTWESTAFTFYEPGLRCKVQLRWFRNIGKELREANEDIWTIFGQDWLPWDLRLALNLSALHSLPYFERCPIHDKRGCPGTKALVWQGLGCDAVLNGKLPKQPINDTFRCDKQLSSWKGIEDMILTGCSRLGYSLLAGHKYVRG